MKNEGMLMLSTIEFEENTEILSKFVTEMFDDIIEEIRNKNIR